MGQNPSTSITEKPAYIPPLILTFTQELIATIMLFKYKRLELKLARTCKTLYERYELYYENKTVIALYDSQNRFYDYDGNIKALHHRMSRHGWVRFKLSPILDLQSSNCPAKNLCLNRALNVPKMLNCACIDALIISPFKGKFMPTISFVESFSNLKCLTLKFFILDNDRMSIVSKLSLLECIYLYECEMTNDLPKIFENYTTLQEIHIVSCNYSKETPIKLLSQLKRFRIVDHFSDIIVNASDCTQLESL